MNAEYYKKYEPIFNTWYLKKMLGEGSYGKVYEIQREDFGTQYKAALKAITIPQSESEIKSVMADGMDEASVIAYYKNFVEEVVGEFVLMSKLKGNSNIVSYEDHMVIQHDNDIGWDILIRMELLTPLIDHIRKVDLTRKDVIKLGIDMCRGLELCQKYNIIHRDIKPENIFISENGDYKLGDFGIARTLEQTSGMLSKKGTQAYMAPEIYREESYGSNVDIYSLGIVMYRLLNENRTPFLPAYPAPITHNDRESAIKKRISGAKISPPANADGRLAEIVMKACDYNPSERYFSPMEMRNELEAILYNKEEAKIIYPKGDNTPIKSIQYIKTGDEIPNIDPQNKTEDLIPDKSHSVDKTDGMFGDRVHSDKTDSDFETRIDEDRFNKTESDFATRTNTNSIIKKSSWKKKAIIGTTSGVIVLCLVTGGFYFTRPASAPVSIVSVSQISNPVSFVFESGNAIDVKTQNALKSRLACFDIPYAFEAVDGKVKVSYSKDIVETGPVNFTKHIDRISKIGNITFETYDGTVVLANEDIKTTQSKIGKIEQGGADQNYAEITLNQKGIKKFSEATSTIATLTDGNNYITVKLDGVLIQKIIVKERIDSAKIVIVPQMTTQTASVGNKVASSFGLTAYASNNELDFNKAMVNLIAVIITDGKLSGEIKVTIDDAIISLFPIQTPEPVVEEWRLEGYEDTPPYKEYEILWKNGQPTAEKRYTGNQKPQEPVTKNSSGGVSKPSSGGTSKPQSGGSSSGGGSSNDTPVQQPTQQQPTQQQPAQQQPTQQPSKGSSGGSSNDKSPEVYVDFN